MPVEFLTDDEAAASGLCAGTPSQADLDRVFFLDDDDLKLAGKHRGEHMRAGFALQLVTVRWLGMFLEEPLDVPDGRSCSPYFGPCDSSTCGTLMTPPCPTSYPASYSA